MHEICSNILTPSATTLTGHEDCQFKDSHDRIVVSTSRCGRDNPGSNPGHGIGQFFVLRVIVDFKILNCLLFQFFFLTYTG